MNKKKVLYDALINSKFTTPDVIGSFDEFNSKLDNPQKRNTLYNAMIESKMFDSEYLGTFGEFESKLMERTESGSIGKAIKPMSAASGEFGMSSLAERKANRFKKVEETKEKLADVKQIINDPIKAGKEASKNVGKAILNTTSMLGEGLVHAYGFSSYAKNPYGHIQADELSKTMYEFSTERAEYFEKLIPTDSEWQNNFFVSDVPQAIGSTMTFAATGGIGRAVGMTPWLAASLSGMLVQAQSMGEEAYGATEDINTAHIASLWGLPLGATEGVGLKRFFKILDKVGKTSLGKMVSEATKEGLEEYVQERLQTIGENLTAHELYDTSRAVFEGSHRAGMAGFLSGFFMGMIGGGINHRRNKNLPGEKESLDKAQGIVDNFIKDNINEIKFNANFTQTLLNPNNPTKTKAYEELKSDYKLTEKQIEKLDNILLNVDGASEIHKAIHKNNPEALKQPGYLNEIIFNAMRDPKTFQEIFGVTIPSRIVSSYVKGISDFIREENLMGETNETDKKSEKNIKEVPIPQKVSRETQGQKINRSKAGVAKHILSGDITTPIALRAAKQILGESFTEKSQSYIEANRPRIEQAKDKIMEEGLVFEDFVRRSVAAKLLDVDDITTDLIGLSNQILIEQATNEAIDDEMDFDELFYQADAWHGSPHTFDKFSKDKIGTGEGAQAFGHGLYFTDKESIGRYYATNVTQKDNYEEMRTWTDEELSARIVQVYNADAAGITNDFEWNEVSIAEEILDKRKKGEDTIQPKSKRNLYKVKLWEGKEQNLLDWNKPITQEQLNKFVDKLKEENPELSNEREKEIKEWKFETGSGFYGVITEEFFNGNEKITSEFLNRAGFDGIKYLAEGGRTNKIAQGITKGEFVDYEGSQIKKIDGKWWNLSADAKLTDEEFERQYGHYLKETYNYVVFDDQAIKIEERIQFQTKDKAPGATNIQQPTQSSTYGQIVAQDSSMEVKQLLQQLEQQGIVDTSIEKFVNWAVKYAGPVKVHLMPSNRTLSDNTQLGNRPGYYARKLSTNEHYIGINKDYQTNDKSDLYRTLAHEITHAAIERGLKENRLFRLQTVELMNDFENTIKNNSTYQESFKPAFESPGEFISYVMSGTSGIRELMENTLLPKSTHSNFLKRLASIIRNYFRNVLGFKEPTYFHGLEIILNNHLGYQPESQYTFNEEEIHDDGYEELIDQVDKTLLITDVDKQDPRMIKSVAQLLGKEEGLSLKEYYSYIKTKNFKTFEKELMQNPEWNKRAKFHYDKYYRKQFSTIEAYQKAIVKNLYNLAHTMVSIPHLKIIINKSKRDGRTDETTSIKEYTEVFKDKKGNTKVAMYNHMKLFDLMGELGELLENKFTPVIIESVEERNYFYNKYLGNRFKSITSSKEADRNNYYSELLGKHGYIYLANWSDKNTVIALKPTEQLNPENIKEIAEHYHNKKLELVDKLLRKEFQERYEQLLKNNGTMEKVLEILDHPLKNYIKKEMSKSRMVRLVLEDLRLGGRIIDGQLVSSLYDINRPETYDAIRMYKRPYLISPTRHVHQDKEEIVELLNQLPVKNHGMSYNEQQGLMTRAIVVNVEKIPSDETITIDGVKYNLKQLLINSLGTSRLDGPIYYVKGGVDTVWDNLHGALKPGVKKGWIGNSFTNQNFRNPFYVKGAFHMIPEADPLSKWLQKHNVTWLVASSSAKVSSYPVVQMLNQDIGQQVFTIPFSEIQRHSEKSGVSEASAGLAQTLTSNYMTENNKSFVDKGWNRAIDDIINHNLANFQNEVVDFSYARIIEYLKDKGLTDTSEYGKSVAGIVQELLLRKIDKVYNNLQQSLPLTRDKKQKEILQKRLAFLNDRIIEINEHLGNQFGNFFQEPFFSLGLKGYLGNLLSNLYNFKVPSSHLVLSPDLGVLSPSRQKVIKDFVRENVLRERQRMWEEIKPYKQLRDKFREYDNALKNTSENREEILNKRKEIAQELENFEDVTDQYESELETFYDSNGNVTIRKDAAKDFINEEMLKYVDENGFLRDGFIMISKDVADEYNVNLGDNASTVMVPSSNGMSAGAHTVIGILDSNLLEPGSIIMNSEYVQTILGKDFDIDTTLFIPKSEAFTEEGWTGFINTLRESYKKHREDIFDFYKAQNSELTDDQTIIDNHPELNIHGDQAKLDFILKHFPSSNFKDNTLFDPLSDGWEILEKFNKEVGIPVNRRKINTFKSSIGLITKVNGEVLNPNHNKSYQTYMINDVLTHHMVDMPANTGVLHYNYDELTAFDQDNGTDFSYDPENSGKIVTAIKSFEDFLFTYVIRLNANYNLDERENIRDYEDVIKYIQEQKDINKLLEKDKRNELLKIYSDMITNDKRLDAKVKSRYISIASEYLRNMKFTNLDNVPMNRLINRIPLEALPNIITSELDYTITQGNMINEILKMYPKIKEIFDKIDKVENVKKAIGALPNSKIIIPGIKVNTNTLLGKMFYLTSGNPGLHDLKIKLISLIYPIDQTTKDKSLIDKSSKENVFVRDAFQKTNELTYPLLFEKLLDTGTYIFKRGVSRIQIGKAKLFKIDDDQLGIEYKGAFWNVKEIPNDTVLLAKEAVNHIKEILGTDPQARYNLTTLMSLGGYNIPLTTREELAIDLLNNELSKFSNDEQLLFWVSLIGKPDNNMIYPLNLVSPEKSSTHNYHSQKILLHLLGQINSESGNNFLNLYGQLFNDNFHGKTIKESQAIKRIIKDNILDNDVEIFYQTPGVKELHETDEDPDVSVIHNVRDIFDIINAEKTKDISKDSTEPIGNMVNLNTGEIENISVLEAVNSITRHQTRITTDINYETVALTKAKRITEVIAELEALEDKGNDTVYRLIKQYRGGFKGLVKEPIKWMKKKREGYKKITEIIETNPLGITSISKTSKGDYVFEIDNKLYIDSNKISKIELVHYGYESTLDQLLYTKNMEGDIFLYKGALEYVKRYAVDNIRILRNMYNYILHTMNDLSSDFGRNDIIEGMLSKYMDLMQRFQGLGLTYFPRIIYNKNMEQLIERIRYQKAEKEINKRIKETRERKAKKLSHNSKYDVSDNEIKGLIDDYLQEIKSKIVKNQYGDYMFAFQMRRVNNDLTHGLYVKDSLVPHQEHQRMFHRMLEVDLMKLNFLDYEYKASVAGREKSKIKLMQKWVAGSVRRPELLTKRTKIENLKEGDKIQFYYAGDHIKGVYKSQDNYYMYLNFDNDLFHDNILKTIEDVRKTHDKIIRTKTGVASQKQIDLIKQLYNEGYIQKYPEGINNKDANDLILQALESKLNSPETWGRYKKSRIYIKDYVGGQITHVSGVDKHLVQRKANWASLAKTISRGLFLGMFSGARANVVDAMHMLNQDFGAPGFFYYLPKGIYYNMRFQSRKHEVELEKYAEEFEQMKDFLNDYKGDAKLFERTQRSYAAAVAAKWLIESGALRRIQFGKDIASANVDWNTAQGVLRMLGKGTEAGSNISTAPREWFEQQIRISAAYMYAYKAVVRDGITDPKEIEGVIEHGVGGTQGLYHSIYKKLGEATQIGSLGMQFSHYNTWILKGKRMEWQQMARSGMKLDIKDFFKYGESETRRSIDPNIKNRYIMDFWYNTVGRTFELLFPGIRAGDPVFRVLNLALYNIAMGLSGDWDDDERYTTEDLAFSFMSFWIGMGYTLPLQAVWNYLMPKKGEVKVSDIIPINNRVTNTMFDIYDWAYPRNNIMFNPILGWDSDSKVVSSSAYKQGASERAWLGFNAFTPVPRKFSSKRSREFQSKPFGQKLTSLIPLFGEHDDVYLPIYNFFKYHK